MASSTSPDLPTSGRVPVYLPGPVRAEAGAPVRRAQLAVLAARLTARDQWLLAMVHEHKVLTSAQIHSLAFGGARTMRKRLVLLTAGLRVLDRFRPLVALGTAPEHYVLGPAGAAWLAAAQGVNLKAFGYHRHRAHQIAASRQLAHTVGTNAFFTALAAEGRKEQASGQLAAWWSEKRCLRLWSDLARPDGYGHYTLAAPGADPATVRHVRFFLEYDTGTEALTRLPAKLPRLRAPGRGHRPGGTGPVLPALGHARREPARPLRPGTRPGAGGHHQPRRADRGPLQPGWARLAPGHRPPPAPRGRPRALDRPRRAGGAIRRTAHGRPAGRAPVLVDRTPAPAATAVTPHRTRKQDLPMGKIAAVAVAALVLLVVMIGAAGAGVASLLGAGDAGGDSTVCGTGTAGVGTNIGDGEILTAAQVANAQIIYQTGVQLGIPAYGEEIAIATAIQESRLQNLTTAVDHDSLGLFQQRPSAGWGTPAELTDPVYASTKFYQALEQVANWQSLPLTVAAQDVQDSAYPSAYAPWQSVSAMLVATFAGTTGPCPTASGASAMPAGYTIPPGTPPQVVHRPRVRDQPAWKAIHIRRCRPAGLRLLRAHDAGVPGRRRSAAAHLRGTSPGRHTGRFRRRPQARRPAVRRRIRRHRPGTGSRTRSTPETATSSRHPTQGFRSWSTPMRPPGPLRSRPSDALSIDIPGLHGTPPDTASQWGKYSRGVNDVTHSSEWFFRRRYLAATA